MLSLILQSPFLYFLFSHLHSPLPVNAEGLHDSQDRFTVVSQVGVIVCKRHGEGLVGCAGVCQHPAVLLDLGYADSLGWVDHQHLPNQVFTVWIRQQEGVSQKKDSFGWLRMTL